MQHTEYTSVFQLGPTHLLPGDACKVLQLLPRHEAQDQPADRGSRTLLHLGVRWGGTVTIYTTHTQIQRQAHEPLWPAPHTH
eukprot:27801-Eustigmatos_ZCMA.PRE.1